MRGGTYRHATSSPTVGSVAIDHDGRGRPQLFRRDNRDFRGTFFQYHGIVSNAGTCHR